VNTAEGIAKNLGGDLQSPSNEHHRTTTIARIGIVSPAKDDGDLLHRIVSEGGKTEKKAQEQKTHDLKDATPSGRR
jgi:hypothetical protein